MNNYRKAAMQCLKNAARFEQYKNHHAARVSRERAALWFRRAAELTHITLDGSWLTEGDEA